MTIEWGAFATVVVASLVAACGVVALFSLGIRLVDGPAPWHRPVAIACFAACAVAVLFGIWLIVPAFHG